MKRYYVTRHDVWCGDHYFAGKPKPRWNLFKNQESHYLELGDANDKYRLILVAADFDNQDHESAWHGHPEVARLQDPASETTIRCCDLCSSPEWAHKQFKSQHHAALMGKLAVSSESTILQIHSAAVALSPAMRLNLSSY